MDGCHDSLCTLIKSNLSPLTVVSSNPADGEVYLIQHYVIKFGTLKFCKYILGLWGRKSVNICDKAETAKYPVDLIIKCQALKYLSRIFQIKIRTHLITL